jgi:hypothetical protein
LPGATIACATCSSVIVIGFLSNLRNVTRPGMDLAFTV